MAQLQPYDDDEESGSYLRSELSEYDGKINGDMTKNHTYVRDGYLECKTSSSGVFLGSENCDVNDLNLLSVNLDQFIRTGDIRSLSRRERSQFRKAFLSIELMIRFYTSRAISVMSGASLCFVVVYALVFGLMVGWSVMKSDYLHLSSNPVELLISFYSFLRETLIFTVSCLMIYLMIRGVVAVERMASLKAGSSRSSQSITEQRLNESFKYSYESQYGHHEVVARMLYLFLIVGRTDRLSDFDVVPLGCVHVTWLMHHCPEWNELVDGILANVHSLSSYWCDGDRTFLGSIVDLNELTMGLAYVSKLDERNFTVFALCAVVSGLIPKNIKWKRFFSEKSFIRYLHGGSSYYTEIGETVTDALRAYDVVDLHYFYEKSLSKGFIRPGQINGVVVVRGGFIPDECSFAA